jgi:hypothetical protein
MSKLDLDLDPDATMSVASSDDDDLQIRYDPSFETVLRDDDDDDDDGSSVPPPPPPLFPISFRDIRGSIFRSKKSVPYQKGDEEAPHAVEIIASKDECESTIEVDASERWMKSCNSKTSNKAPQRRAVICTAVLVFFALVLGLSIGLSGGNDSKDTNKTTSSNEALDNNSGSTSTEAPVAATDAPVAATEAPVAATEAPVAATEAPVATDPPVTETMTPTIAATEGCVTSLAPAEACYEPFQGLTIDFDNCAPLGDDWIGIWPAGAITNPARLPEPLIWLWTCGSQNCNAPILEDSLLFGEGLSTGTYVAHMIRLSEDQAPYTSSYAVSDSIEIRPVCN